MALDIFCSTRPRAGNSDCSARCGWWLTAERIVMAVADGQGQGPEAIYAAEVALACIGAGLDRPCAQMFAECDGRLHDTRGVALALAIIDTDSRCISMAAVGNIRVVLMAAGGDFRLQGRRGLVGSGYEGLTPGTIAIASGDMLAMYSAGIGDFLALRQILHGAELSPRNRAVSLLDNWASADDDAAVLIYRHRA